MGSQLFGATTRMIWKQLAPEWSDFGEDEWRAARAESKGAAAESAAEMLELRAKRAAELFWEGREKLLLTPEELHTTLWEALCQFVVRC